MQDADAKLKAQADLAKGALRDKLSELSRLLVSTDCQRYICNMIVFIQWFISPSTAACTHDMYMHVSTLSSNCDRSHAHAYSMPCLSHAHHIYR